MISIVVILRRIWFSRHGSIQSYTSLYQGFHMVDQMNIVTIPPKMTFTGSDEETSIVLDKITSNASNRLAIRIAMTKPIRLRLREIFTIASFLTCLASENFRTASARRGCKSGVICSGGNWMINRLPRQSRAPRPNSC
jgi:hypothetical protein